jgi:hypothetical protein
MSDSQTPSQQLLVVHPSVKMGGDVYRKLREAGYLVVRGDPSQFKIVSAVPLLSSDMILGAAMVTIAGVEQRERAFGAEIVKRLLAAGIGS